METRKLDCKGCSNFCPLIVTIENGSVVSVEGNCCHRGLISAKKQVENKKMSTAEPGAEEPFRM